MFDTYIKSSWNYIWNAPIIAQSIVGAASVYVLYRLVIKKKYRLPPGPRGLPFLGNLTALKNDPLISKLCEWNKEYGPVITIYLGPKRFIVISDIDLMTEALVTRGSDFSGRPFFYSFDKMTQGSKAISAATYGDTWKCQRKVAAQSLRQYLTGRQFEERVHEVLQLVFENIESEKGPFFLNQILSFGVFNILHGLCFGTTKKIDDPNFKKIFKVIDEGLAESGNGFYEDVIPLLHYWPTKEFKHFIEEMSWLTDYIKERVEECKADFNKDSMRCLTDNVILAQRELIETDSDSIVHMTDTHATQIIFDVFGAGNDTSHSTLDWIFLVLVANPVIQARMQKEIDEVVGEKIPGKEHRAKLIYTEAVILEAMRLYPVAPLSVPHETLCDTSVGGYQIPGKTAVLINQYFILRDPKHWKDPLEFKPERFISEDETRLIVRNPSFIPFSAGHRSCPGESLAKLSIVYVVVGLLQKFTISLPPGEKADFTPITDGFGYCPSPYKVIVKSR